MVHVTKYKVVFRYCFLPCFCLQVKNCFCFHKKTLLFLYMDPVDYDVDVKKYMYKRTVPFNLIGGRNKCFLFFSMSMVIKQKQKNLQCHANCLSRFTFQTFTFYMELH